MPAKEMKNLFTRIRNVTQYRLSTPTALVIIVVSAFLAAFGVARHWRWYGQHSSCRGHRVAIAKAEGKYWMVHHRFVTGNEDALAELVRSGFLKELQPCNEGGRYSVVEGSDHVVIVHCSLPNHDENFDGSKGVRHRPDPLTDSPSQ